MRRNPDVLVIGGGVIGCAIAHAVAGSGRSVLLVDRGDLGGEASSAAAGVLAVASGGEADGPGLALRRASLERFAPLVEALQTETGIEVEYEPTGVLELCLTEDDEAEAAARIVRRRAQGFRVERLDARALRGEAPGANPTAGAAVLFADDARVSPARLVAALAAAAGARGAELVAGAAVLGAERAGDRIARVRVGAQWVIPETVVLAAGAWAAHVPGIAPGLRVQPARGQMLALRPSAPLCCRVLSYEDGYLVPCRGGEVLLGATVEHVGFKKAVTPGGLGALTAKLGALAPAALDAPVVRQWAGLRPFAPDGGPILGRPPGTTNLILTCGHHRNGILLAPITAEVVTSLLEGRPPRVDIGPFLPASQAAA
jgi:glycine oxidase